MKAQILSLVIVVSLILIGIVTFSYFEKAPEKKVEVVTPVAKTVVKDSTPKIIYEKKIDSTANKKVAVKTVTKNLRDPGSKFNANVYWNGKYPLYSFVSDKEIKPVYGETYEFWYAHDISSTNQDPSPLKMTLQKGQSYTAYKFITYNECLNWINSYTHPVQEKSSNNYSSQQSIPSQSNSVAGYYSSSIGNNWIRLTSNGTGKLYINDDILSFGSITFNWTLSGGKINIQFYDEAGQAASYWFYYSENRIEVPSISSNMIFLKTN